MDQQSTPIRGRACLSENACQQQGSKMVKDRHKTFSEVTSNE